ncbi:unnamed protein product [Protopolystoma xenopodis]|uniref:Uncharacterized protein n=1 Tax=Protopolystoma xenopodis TaxID=117903 RepID=A0A3S5A613_9PLAT|nr:unnamed protein product [Protopolystoma xenopodis]
MVFTYNNEARYSARFVLATLPPVFNSDANGQISGKHGEITATALSSKGFVDASKFVSTPRLTKQTCNLAVHSKTNERQFSSVSLSPDKSMPLPQPKGLTQG